MTEALQDSEHLEAIALENSIDTAKPEPDPEPEPEPDPEPEDPPRPPHRPDPVDVSGSISAWTPVSGGNVDAEL